MTNDDIDSLVARGKFPEHTERREMIETHISWVILCDRFVYKIKKPIQYSFLDFSTLKMRKYYCERELELNQRFSKNMYLDVIPVYHSGSEDQFCVGGNGSAVIDYCLKMRKLDPEKQMDVLLRKNKVFPIDIKNLAKCVADFHKATTIIYEKDILDVQRNFNDLAGEKAFLSSTFDMDSDAIIDHAIAFSNSFLKKNKPLLEIRLRSGFVRDCHGDLHTRNIFLLPEPQPFDCIEFNDDYRHIDISNEVAFLCMDLDALGRNDLAKLFMDSYNLLLPVITTDVERSLFIYYKSYRANVRAKVNSLRAQSATDAKAKTNALAEAKKYLLLMDGYINSF